MIIIIIFFVLLVLLFLVLLLVFKEIVVRYGKFSKKEININSWCLLLRM